MTDMKPITREEFIAAGNPPDQWDALLEMAQENSEYIRRTSMHPHPWDDWADRDLKRKRMISGPPKGTA